MTDEDEWSIASPFQLPKAIDENRANAQNILSEQTLSKQEKEWVHFFLRIYCVSLPFCSSF
jgi:hypothetical protein